MTKNADWASLSKVSLSFPCVLGLSEWERRETQRLNAARQQQIPHVPSMAAIISFDHAVPKHGSWPATVVLITAGHVAWLEPTFAINQTSKRRRREHCDVTLARAGA